MIILEVCLAILIFITILIWQRKNSKVIGILMIAQWLIVVSQIILFGWRWPMIPLYSFTIYQSVKLFSSLGTTRLRNKVITLMFLFFSLLLPSLLFPWYKLSQPTGVYEVGTRSLEVVDINRSEKWSTSESSRRLMIQLWYPTDTDDNSKKARYHNHPGLFTKEFGELNGLPGFLLQSFAKQRTPAYKDTPLVSSGQPFPVIFFSHGFGSNRSQSHFQVLELASHGYIVIGIDHSYYSPGTVFLDGTNPGVLNIEFSDDEEVMNEYLYEWSKDAQSVMDWVERLNRGELEEIVELGQFVGRLDLGKVGYLGHSFGGASASHTLAIDKRFHAGMNMDGFPYGRADELGVEQPFLTLTSDKEVLKNYVDDEYLETFYRKISAISGEENVISIEGALHLDFSDFPLLSPITSWIGMTGKFPPGELHRLINKVTLEFFNENL